MLSTDCMRMNFDKTTQSHYVLFLYQLVCTQYYGIKSALMSIVSRSQTLSSILFWLCNIEEGLHELGDKLVSTLAEGFRGYQGTSSQLCGIRTLNI
jgi:hypothetical protein